MYAVLPPATDSDSTGVRTNVWTGTNEGDRTVPTSCTKTSDKEPFKLRGVVPMGRGTISGTDKFHYCASCGETEENVQLQCCSACKLTLYCSKECQGTHWTSHEERCKPYTCFKETSDPVKTPTVRELVGEKSLIRCFLHQQRIQALWDTGSQICAVDEVWKENHLPDVTLREKQGLATKKSSTVTLAFPHQSLY